MTSLDEMPTFNLKAVVRETGLKPDTLRAWERRYGLPEPARTSGGHRLYSQRDIDILKWLIARQEEGLSISRAVDLWNQFVDEGKDPFVEMAGEGEEQAGLAPLEVGDTLTQLRQSWIEACLDFDEQRAEYTLAQTFALYPPETACLEVLQKGLAEIGDRWYAGDATAQQEHFASALAMRRLEALIAINPRPTRAGRILVGCPPAEEHTFSPLLLTLLLRRRGWDALYLGANVPLDRLESTIEGTEPNLVILTAQRLHTAATLLAMAERLRREEIPLAFGGRIFNVAPALRERIPGYFLGERLAKAPIKVEQLMTAPTFPLQVKELAPALVAALKEFRERQPLIEAYTWEHADNLDIPAVHLVRANTNLGEGIQAALALGDVALLGHDIDWVAGLLRNFDYEMAADVLQRYLHLYLDAALRHLGRRGAPIKEWLQQVVNAKGE